MAGSINPQDACNNIITVLTAGMTAKLAALTTEYDDGITLAAVSAYWRAPQELYPKDVNIVVVALGTNAINSPEQRQQHDVMVEVIVAGNQSSSTYAGAEMVTIRLWRTVRAVQELLNKTTLSDNVDQVYIERVDASDVGVDGGRFEQRAALSIEVFTS